MKLEIAEIFLGIFCLALLLQLFYYFFFYSRIAFHKNTNPEPTNYPPVSIVICARSESGKLVNNLPDILEQDYPNFEVVVVNDRSWDDTKEILKAFEVRYTNLRTIHIAESNHDHYGKKMALTIGIKGTKNDLMLMTDADCKPMSNQWIKKMVSVYSENKKIVLGYSPYQKEKGFLNKLIRFDTFLAGLHYLSFAKANVPYMGVGRNLMYSKELFFKVSGFKNHYHISSGDDDLFVNEAATKNNTVIMIDAKSHIKSYPKSTFKDWFRQKKRHFTTGPFYKTKHKLLLALPYLILITLLTSAIVSIVLNKYLLIILGGLAFRWLIQILIFNQSMKRLGDRDLTIWAPILELCLFALHPAIMISNKFIRAEKWN